MQRKIGIVVAWVAATVLSILIATAAVGAVRGRVTDNPQSVAAPASLLETTTTTSAPPTSSPSSTTSTIGTSPGTAVGSTTSTSPPEDPGTTSTTQTTATTQPAVESQIKTYAAVGGSVTVEVSGGALRLLGATPNPGFTVSEKELSSTRIEIEFRSSSHESKVDVRLRDGVLDVSVEEGGEDD